MTRDGHLTIETLFIFILHSGQTMKVKDLIKQLKKRDKNLEVYIQSEPSEYPSRCIYDVSTIYRSLDNTDKPDKYVLIQSL